MFNVHSGFSVAESLGTVARYQNAFGAALVEDDLRSRVPAAFAHSASGHLRSSYTFIPTARIVAALHDVGFVPVDARQAQTRRVAPQHARHLLRFRRRLEVLALGDAVPELVLINSHDGASAYQLRLGLYRPVCRNGLMASLGEFAALHVAHRGDVVERVVVGAQQMSERFTDLGSIVTRMMQRTLETPELQSFAAQALGLRYPQGVPVGLRAEQLLMPKRAADVGDDLWDVFNVVQEWLLRGGLARRSAQGRRGVTRPIRAIREDVRLNTGLWEIATSYLAAA